MNKIPRDEIEKLANRAKVNETAVWNFLGTAHFCGSIPNALMNLDMDARLYGWNKETTQAIRDGLLIKTKP
jgi:hypothetical protein